MPQIYDMGPTALLPLRRKACWGFFFALKIQRLWPGLNPQTWVLKASTLPLDHRSCLFYNYLFKTDPFSHNTPIYTLVSSIQVFLPNLICNSLTPMHATCPHLIFVDMITLTQPRLGSLLPSKKLSFQTKDMSDISVLRTKLATSTSIYGLACYIQEGERFHLWDGSTRDFAVYVHRRYTLRHYSLPQEASNHFI